MRTNCHFRIMLRYGLAVVSVAAATVLTHWLTGIGDAGISPLFFAAVLLAGWYGGRGPGLLATLLSGAATAYLLLLTQATSYTAVRDLVLRLLVFTVVSLLASSLHVALKRAADASRRAKEAAEEASAAKSKFLAMVSHELRTPLSPVLMVADMLEQDPSLSPGVRNDIRSIRRNVDLEIRLIEDLVDLTRISAGKLRLREEVIDVHEPLRAAIEVCEADLRDKGLHLATDFAATQSHVRGDAVRLQQIFWNLVRNAVKFTPTGGRISVGTRNAPNGSLLLDVSDTGIGIEPQQLGKIFQAFEQGEPDIQVRFGGLGLGLAICQALVEAHQGSIRASSNGRGRGATFSVTLPVCSEAAAQSDGPDRHLPNCRQPSGVVVS
jgi:signal transduction histidine kinase